jgi:hypothetical protein
MSNSSQEKYGIINYRAPGVRASFSNDFMPSRQSLKSAQDIVRRSEKRRRAAALSRHGHRSGTVSSSAAGPARSDNVIPFHSPVWARPSARLVYSRHLAQPYALAPTPHARRASLQKEARRLSRHLRASPFGAIDGVIFEGVSTDALEHFGVMAIQALAVILGMGALLVLLTLL